jgi:hypothetical protein
MSEIGMSVQQNGGVSEVQEIHVFDGGTIKKVTEAWVSDNGTIKRFWPQNGSVELFTVTSDTNTFSTARITYNTTYMDNIAVSDALGYTQASSVEDTFFLRSGLIPDTTYTYNLQATDKNGNIVNAGPITHRTTKVNKPTNVTQSIGTLSGTTFPVTLSWAAVSGASFYNIYRITQSGTVFVEGSITSTSRVLNLAANTSYTLYVTAVYSRGGLFYSSDPSNSVTFTTPSIAPPAGTYTFKPTSNFSWSPNLNVWRSTADKLFHGRFDSNRGNQASYFFGYKDSSNRSFGNSFYANANISKIQIFVTRDGSTGSSAGQENRFKTHTYNSKPANSPVNANGVNQGTLTYNDSGWFTIYDVSDSDTWTTARENYAKLLTGELKGIVWGDIDSRYMASAATAANNLNLSTPAGSVRFILS